VQVAIAPANASVDVDGTAATVTDGHVDISGSLGSTHHLRIAVGKKETQGDVVIAESGAIPPRFELGLKTAAAAPAAVVASAKAGSPANAPPAAPTPAAASAPAKPAGALDRDFR
jgi:hypothetical protein